MNPAERKLFHLQRPYVGSLRSLRTGLDIEGNLLSLIEGFEAIHINCTEMNKVILFVLTSNKTIPLATVKPFDSSLTQICNLLNVLNY